MPVDQKNFTVKFGKIARTVEYTDSEGLIHFTTDLGSEDKVICLQHHPDRNQSTPNYAIAFERTKAFLESCGFGVETLGVLAEPSKITGADVQAIIERELSGDPLPPTHGFDLPQRLVQPTRLQFVSQPGNDTWNLWLVLGKIPAIRNGYKIVFDENSKQFGVAIKGTFLGFEGTFVQTFEAILRAT